jgi:hypothetical protein
MGIKWIDVVMPPAVGAVVAIMWLELLLLRRNKPDLHHGQRT